MKSTVETLSPTRAKLTVEVSFEELKPNFDKAYEALAGQVNIPGFRKGKIPPAVLESRLGRGAVLDQVINDMIPAKYQDAVLEHGLKPLAQPEIDISKLEDGEVIEFTAEVDVRPEVTTPDLEKISAEVEVPAAADDAVEVELNNLRARFGSLKGVDRPVQDKDFVSIDLSAVVDGKEVEEATTNGLSYELGSGELIEGIDEALIGVEAGGSKEFESTLVAGEYAGKKATVTATVQSVKERELPEADDEFASMASPHDTMEDLMKDLEAQVEKQTEAQLAIAVRDAVLEQLLAAADLPVPDAVVDAEAKAQIDGILQQFGGDEAVFEQALAAEDSDRESFEKDTREAAVKTLQTQFLMDHIAETNETPVSQEDISQHVFYQAQRYGMDPNQFFQQIQSSGQIGSLLADVRRSKALADVITSVKVVDKDGNAIDTEKLFGSEEVEADSEESSASDSE